LFSATVVTKEDAMKAAANDRDDHKDALFGFGLRVVLASGGRTSTPKARF
jgi:hypothetical protein